MTTDSQQQFTFNVLNRYNGRVSLKETSGTALKMDILEGGLLLIFSDRRDMQARSDLKEPTSMDVVQFRFSSIASADSKVRLTVDFIENKMLS